MSFQTINPETHDVGLRMGLRTLLQFRRSVVFHAVLAAFAGEVQALTTALREVLVKRAPADAIGAQLDVLGKIVGQARGLIDWASVAWFLPDTPHRSVDQSPVWVQGAPLGTTAPMDDATFRSLLEAKVARNHTSYGSVPELKDVVRRAFGVELSVEQVAPLVIDLVVEDTASDNVLAFLERAADAPTADSVYYLPIPAGVRIGQVLRFSDYP